MGTSLTCWGCPCYPSWGFGPLTPQLQSRGGLHPFGPGLSSHSPAEDLHWQNDPSVPQFPHARKRHHTKLRGIRFVPDGNTGFFSFSWEGVSLHTTPGKLKAKEGSIWMPAPRNLAALMEQHRLHARLEIQHHQPANGGCPWFLQMGKAVLPCLWVSGHVPSPGLP